jgi:chitinase
VGESVQFTSTVEGSSDQAVTWSVLTAGGGSITPAGGLYTAPATAGVYTIQAVAQADGVTSATALVGVAPASATGLFVTGYWADWTVGNMQAYPYTVIDWTALTHLTVALSYPNAAGDLHYVGGNLGSALAKSVTAAAHQHGRKAILMIGGSGSSADFAVATGDTPTTALAFARKIAAFAQADGFDGVDLDWEGIYASNNGAPGDGVRIKNLALALRATWPSAILTVAMGWDQTDQAFWGGMKDGTGAWLFDQFNVMNYDAANGWPAWVSWFHNALDDADPANRPSSIARSLPQLAARGVPSERIGLGLPFYGSAWTRGSGATAYGPRQAIAVNYNAATQGADTTWTYKYILDHYVTPFGNASGVTTDAAGRTTPDGTHAGYVFDLAAGVPYITGGTAGIGPDGVRFLSFEDPVSIAGKGAWCKANGFGGAIVWLINEGATDGAGTNPLLAAVKTSFLQ